jgi:penicillin-binding protein 1A
MDYMKTALAGKPEKSPAQPAGVVTMKIDPTNGQVAQAGDPDAIFEYFLAEHTPKPVDTRALDRGKGHEEEIKPIEIF